MKNKKSNFTNPMESKMIKYFKNNSVKKIISDYRGKDSDMLVWAAVFLDSPDDELKLKALSVFKNVSKYVSSKSILNLADLLFSIVKNPFVSTTSMEFDLEMLGNLKKIFKYTHSSKTKIKLLTIISNKYQYRPNLIEEFFYFGLKKTEDREVRLATLNLMLKYNLPLTKQLISNLISNLASTDNKIALTIVRILYKLKNRLTNEHLSKIRNLFIQTRSEFFETSMLPPGPLVLLGLLRNKEIIPEFLRLIYLERPKGVSEQAKKAFYEMIEIMEDEFSRNPDAFLVGEFRKPKDYSSFAKFEEELMDHLHILKEKNQTEFKFFLARELVYLGNYEEVSKHLPEFLSQVCMPFSSTC